MENKIGKRKNESDRNLIKTGNYQIRFERTQLNQRDARMIDSMFLELVSHLKQKMIFIILSELFLF